MTRAKTSQPSKSRRRTAANQSLESSGAFTATDVARRAYELYLARGCEHGHDSEDWLQAERELNDAARPALVTTSPADAADVTSLVAGPRSQA